MWEIQRGDMVPPHYDDQVSPHLECAQQIAITVPSFSTDPLCLTMCHATAGSLTKTTNVTGYTDYTASI